MIYFDNGAAEAPMLAAITAAEEVLTETWANPNSIHKAGMQANEIVQNSKNIIAGVMNCEPDEVYFCSCACEAASWAIKCMRSVCYFVHYNEKEHSCVVDAMRHWNDYETKTPENLLKIGDASMLANNETGEIYSIPKDNVLRFVDATAAVGHIPVDFKALGCDYLCADATKFGGIPGAAFLIIKRGAPIVPLIYGNETRGGTPPTALICAMEAALKKKAENMNTAIKETVAMRDYLIEHLLRIPDAHLNGPWTPGSSTDRLPGNVNISFAGIDGTALGLILSERGLMVSAGSACTSGNNEPSHVLLAMGVPPELAKGTIRITINENNTMQECEEAVKLITDCVATLRKL